MDTEQYYNPTPEEYRAFFQIKAGITPPAEKAKEIKRYTLYYKNTPVPGYMDKEYKLCKWKMSDMIGRGQALKPYLEIRCTKRQPQIKKP